MPRDKFLLNQLIIHFTRCHLTIEQTILMMKGSKQYDFLTLRIKVKILNNEDQNKTLDKD